MTDYEKLYYLASEWVKTQMRSFTIDDLRKSLKNDLDRLILSNSSYGALMHELCRDKLIIGNGYVDGIRPNGKKKVITQWISREYSLKQQANATRDKTLKLEL